MLSYGELVKEVLRHDPQERQALLEEIKHSLEETSNPATDQTHGLNGKADLVTYIGKLDEAGQPVVLVQGADGAEKPLPRSPFAQQFAYDYSWGERGPGTGVLAHSLLEYQFGVADADKYMQKFAYEVIKDLPSLKNNPTGAGWQLSGREISRWLEQKRLEPPSEKEIWRAERADYLTEKYK